MTRKLNLMLGIVIGALAALWVVGERGHLMLPSTRQFMREHGWRGLLNGQFWHAYFYGRWTNQYIGWGVRYTFPRVKPVAGKRYWGDEYHGKILPTELAQALISINQPIPRQDLEQLIPYPKAREIVLNGPPEIVAYECGCRAARENPCQPTQVCLVVGQPFADFVLEHNPQSSRRLTQTEALQLLQEEHARGHLHAAYFKDVMLNRFYAICNCCACCCGGLESMRRGVPMVTSSGYVAEVDQSRCEACGACAKACPFGAIHVNGASHVDWEKCMGCGVCEGQCPQRAITLGPDARKGQPLDARQLVV
jgi:ferredoxin